MPDKLGYSGPPGSRLCGRLVASPPLPKKNTSSPELPNKMLGTATRNSHPLSNLKIVNLLSLCTKSHTSAADSLVPLVEQHPGHASLSLDICLSLKTWNYIKSHAWLIVASPHTRARARARTHYIHQLIIFCNCFSDLHPRFNSHVLFYTLRYCYINM